jgi:uncharacterized protein (TIGR00369 family)
MEAEKSGFLPKTEDFEQRVRASFANQGVMKLIGAEVAQVVPGEVEIQFPFRFDLTQQDGFLHAGIMTAVVDTACGYAAFTLMPAQSGVLTVEYKMNFLAPAKGEKFIARGRVLKPGKIITVCTGEVFAISGEATKLVATINATMMMMEGR